MHGRMFHFGVVAISALFAVTGAADAMSTYTWKKRPLVVIAPDDANPELARQRSVIAAARSGFAERDMVIVTVIGDSVSADLGSTPGQSAKALRARYGVSQSGFRALLIGKDGGVKLSSGSPISAATLFGEIDAMPMRVDEMRRRK
jgi:Domain of unknown function (DUF4174)